MGTEQFFLWLEQYLLKSKSESNGLTANQVKSVKRKMKTVATTSPEEK